MSTRVIFALPLTLAVTFLHISCCVLPLVSIASASLFYFDFLVRFNWALTGLQILTALYLLVKLVLDSTGVRRLCSRKERAIYGFSLLISLAGLGLNYYEPFKTENQVLAAQQFLLFKHHRQLQFGLTEACDEKRLLADLRKIRGIKPDRIQITDHRVALTFQSNQTSRSEIFSVLRAKGYVLVALE